MDHPSSQLVCVDVLGDAAGDAGVGSSTPMPWRMIRATVSSGRVSDGLWVRRQPAGRVNPTSSPALTETDVHRHLYGCADARVARLEDQAGTSRAPAHPHSAVARAAVAEETGS